MHSIRFTSLFMTAVLICGTLTLLTSGCDEEKDSNSSFSSLFLLTLQSKGPIAKIHILGASGGGGGAGSFTIHKIESNGSDISTIGTYTSGAFLADINGDVALTEPVESGDRFCVVYDGGSGSVTRSYIFYDAEDNALDTLEQTNIGNEIVLLPTWLTGDIYTEFYFNGENVTLTQKTLP